MPYSGNVYHFWGLGDVKGELRYLRPFQRARITSIELRDSFTEGLFSSTQTDVILDERIWTSFLG